MGLAPNPEPRANMARSVSVALLLVFIISTLLFMLSARLGVAQQRAHFRLCRPVHLNICLMLRKEFPAVLRHLIPLKDWAGFGILNRCGLLKDRQ